MSAAALVASVKGSVAASVPAASVGATVVASAGTLALTGSAVGLPGVASSPLPAAESSVDAGSPVVAAGTLSSSLAGSVELLN